MKILYLITGLGGCGVEKVIVDLADQMYSLDHDVKIAYLKGEIIVVGTGEDESALKKMTFEYGVYDSIEFVGQQKNMDLFYRKASFFCMSSRFEGLPMVLLEAQSYGLPIVAFDCDTGPAGINGYLAKKEDVNDFSDRILKMCTEREFESFSVAASKKSLDYDAKKIAIKWSNII